MLSLRFIAIGALTALALAIPTVSSAANMPDLQNDSDSGTSNTDNITNDTSPTFTIFCNSGETITLYRNGVSPVASSTCDLSNTIALTDNSVSSDGTYSYTSTDDTSESSALNVTIDTIANATGTPDLDPGSDTGSSPTDNITQDSTPTFNISCESGTTVQLYEGANAHGSTTCSGGSVTITSDDIGTGDRTFYANQTDIAGNLSSLSSGLTITIDTNGPSAPGTPDLRGTSDSGSSSFDDITSTSPLVFDISCENGTIVSLTRGGSFVASAECSSNTVSLSDSSGSTGSLSYAAFATDVAGNNGSASNGLNVTVDTTAPSAPGTPDMQPGSDSGTSSNDDITNNTNPTFDILCEANATVQLRVDGTDNGSSGTCGAGIVSLAASNLSNGSHTITAVETDSAGNGPSTPSSPSLSVTIDTSISTTNTPDLDTGSDSGVSATDNITNDNTPTFVTNCENGATVQLYQMGSPRGSSNACSGGSVYLTTDSLSDGTYDIYAVQIDTAGNNSGSSNAITITIDTSSPSSPGMPDLRGTSDSGTSSTDDITNTNPLVFDVSCENGTIVSLTRGGSFIASGECSGSTVSLSDSSGSTGGFSYAAFATDVAGNSGGTSNGLSVTIDATNPSAPGTPDMQNSSDSGISSSDDITNNTNPTFDISCESNATVQLRVDGTDNGSSGICSAGSVSLTASNLSNGIHAITAVQTDSAGNGPSAPSSPGLSVNIDVEAPNIPGTPDLDSGSDSGISSTDDITNSTSPSFTISCTSGLQVELIQNGTTITSGTCSNSNIHLSANSLMAGSYSFSAKQQDDAGNYSYVSNSLNVTINTTTYNSPGTPDLSYLDDSGISDNDNVTKVTNPSFSISCADNGVTVWLLQDGVIVNSGTCSGGNVNITDNSWPSEASHTYTAEQGNDANISGVSSYLTVAFDFTAPAASGTPDLTSGSDTGISSTDNSTSSTSPSFTIGCVDGAIVTLVINDGMPATVGICNSSTITLSPSASLSEGTYTVGSRQTDPAGNTSADSTTISVTIDTTAPNQPGTPDLKASSDTGANTTDNLTGDATPTFDISCETSATVALYLNGSVVGSAPCISGNATITASTTPNGDSTFSAKQTDVAGNLSDPSNGLTVTIDTTAPSNVGIPDLVAADDSGSSNTDNLTNDTTPRVTIGSCTDGLTVQVTISGGSAVVGTAVCSTTIATVTLSLPLNQTYDLRAWQLSALEVASSLSSPLSVTIDTQISAPSLPDLAAASDTGTSATDNTTDADSLTLDVACNEETVALKQDGTEISTQVCSGGTAQFIVDASAFADGPYVFTATQTDAAGNVSTNSSSLTVTIGLPVISSSSSSESSSDGGGGGGGGGGGRILRSASSSSSSSAASSKSSASSSGKNQRLSRLEQRRAARLRQHSAAPAKPSPSTPPIESPLPTQPVSPSSSTPMIGDYIVNTHALKLRAIPKIPCIILGLLTEGEAVTVLGKDEWWAFIETSSGQQGYVRVEFLKAINPSN